jgi:hypothetical protein
MRPDLIVAGELQRQEKEGLVLKLAEDLCG